MTGRYSPSFDLNHAVFFFLFCSSSHIHLAHSFTLGYLSCHNLPYLAKLGMDAQNAPICATSVVVLYFGQLGGSLAYSRIL